MDARQRVFAGYRRRGQALGRCVALSLALIGALLAPSASTAQAPATTTYLALGDSISFGFAQEIYNLHYPSESPSYFEEGVANFFAKDLAKSSEVGKSIRLVNDACPGETSNTMIGENPEVGGEASTETLEEVEGKPQQDFPAGAYQGFGDWLPCKTYWIEHAPLHNGGYVKNGKDVSQLEEALEEVKNPNNHVKAITLDIGLNDQGAGVTKCEDDYITGKNSSIADCIAGEASSVTAHIVKNVDDIIGKINEAGYTGPIVLLGFYNPYAFTLPGSDALQQVANTALEAEVLPHFSNVTFADPFPVFNKGAGKSFAKEKASLCKYTELCNSNVTGGSEDQGDPHPSVAGYKALAKLLNVAYLANSAR